MGSPRHHGSAAVFLLLVAALASHQRELAGQQADPRGGVLLYTRDMVGTYLSTGHDDMLVAFAQGDYVCPRLLPGRDQVLLNSRRGGRPGIWLQDVEGGGREKVCDGDQVSVSPDGRWIVFRRDGVIVQRELASGAEQPVSPEGWAACSYPSFAADGAVLFVSTDEGQGKVYSADPEDRASPRLLLAGEIGSAPRCSPDGRAMAYQSGPHLYLLDLATQRHRRLTFAGGVQSWPMWGLDSRSVAYLQSPGPVDGPRHICRVQVEAPREVSLVLRDVGIGPDWDGLSFEGEEPSTLSGDDVRLCVGEGPVPLSPEAAEVPKPAGGWKDLPAGGATGGDVLVECEWGGVYVSGSTGSVLLAEGKGGALIRTAEVRLVSEGDEPATRVESVTAAEPDADDVRLAAVFETEGGGRVTATLGVSRTRPLLELKPTENLGSVQVRRPLQLAVVPDRLASDLLYDPAEHNAPAVPLPRAPFVLGLPIGGGLVMVVTPSREQTVQLAKATVEGAFAGLEARCAGESVFVSVLPGDDLWWTADVKAAGEGEPWQIAWSNPFAAQWRLATQGGSRSLALMRLVDSPTSEEAVPLAETQGWAKAPSRSLVYAYGRSPNTPPERVMPSDILYDALGLEGASRLLDTEGIRAYRHAEEWVPYKDPRVACKIINWIRRRDRPGGQQRIDDVCRDIVLSLQGLDLRAQEYEGFVGELERMRGQGAASDSGKALLDSAAQQVAELRDTLGQRPVAPLSEVEANVEAFRSHADAAYTPFASRVTAALRQRLAALAAYRQLAKSVREEAGLTLARSPEAREAGERVRDLAGQTLRKRYYLEADWLGEEPLGEPEVPYEQITDL